MRMGGGRRLGGEDRKEVRGDPVEQMSSRPPPNFAAMCNDLTLLNRLVPLQRPSFPFENFYYAMLRL